jgi:hypothetical protein
VAGKLIVIPAQGDITEETYEDKSPSLEHLQRLVGGYIEPIQVLWEGRRLAFVDEDGLHKKLAANARATRLVHGMVNVGRQGIVGTMVIVESA